MCGEGGAQGTLAVVCSGGCRKPSLSCHLSRLLLFSVFFVLFLCRFFVGFTFCAVFLFCFVLCAVVVVAVVVLRVVAFACRPSCVLFFFLFFFHFFPSLSGLRFTHLPEASRRRHALYPFTRVRIP